MTDPKAKRAGKFWYSLVAIIAAQLVLLGVMFIGTSIRAQHIAEQEQRNILCPMVTLLVDVYNDPKTPPAPDPYSAQLRAVIRKMFVQLTCREGPPS